MVSTDQWLVANINMTGFYRVNYDSGNWDRLLATLNTNHQVGNLVNDAAWSQRLLLLQPPHRLFYFFRRFQWSTEPKLSTMPLTWQGETFFLLRSIVVGHWRHTYLTVLLFSGLSWWTQLWRWAPPSSSPRRWSTCPGRLPYATWTTSTSCLTAVKWTDPCRSVVKVLQLLDILCNSVQYPLKDLLVKRYSWVSCRWLDHGKLSNFHSSGLPQEAGDSTVQPLQRRHQQLDKYPRRTHWPVRIKHPYIMFKK